MVCWKPWERCFLRLNTSDVPSTSTARYASRILFLQDGAIFTELRKGNDSRSAFFEKILNVLTMIGGGQSHVLYCMMYPKEPAVAELLAMR